MLRRTFSSLHKSFKNPPSNQIKIALALSGGVDSSITALLLRSPSNALKLQLLRAAWYNNWRPLNATYNVPPSSLINDDNMNNEEPSQYEQYLLPTLNFHVEPLHMSNWSSLDEGSSDSSSSSTATGMKKSNIHCQRAEQDSKDATDVIEHIVNMDSEHVAFGLTSQNPNSNPNPASRITSNVMSMPSRLTSFNTKVHPVSFESDYWTLVFEPFLSSLSTLSPSSSSSSTSSSSSKSTTITTPNPDVQCNKSIKFDVLRKHAFGKLGCHVLATGHYSVLSYPPIHNIPTSTDTCIERETETETGSVSKSKFDGPKLLEAKDKWKDQSYFLCTVQSDMMNGCVFPVGSYLKSKPKSTSENSKDNSDLGLGLGDVSEIPTIRSLAETSNLPNKYKPDSTGICFIGSRTNFSSFLSNYIDNPSTPSSPSPSSTTTTDSNTNTSSTNFPPLTFHDIDHHSSLSTSTSTSLIVVRDRNNRIVPFPKSVYTTFYTVGQNAKLPGLKEKFFVHSRVQSKAKSKSKSDEGSGNSGNGRNEVWLCKGTHHPSLYSGGLMCKLSEFTWSNDMVKDQVLTIGSGSGGKHGVFMVRIRHQQPLVECFITIGYEDDDDCDSEDKGGGGRGGGGGEGGGEEILKFTFVTPLRAICPGQVIAVYSVLPDLLDNTDTHSHTDTDSNNNNANANANDSRTCLGGGEIYRPTGNYQGGSKSLPKVLHSSGGNDFSKRVEMAERVKRGGGG